ncbi:hypothetical protein ACJRO7_009936 [Eucalyptus globulus]|uniref:Uncharacterized protein n=1 Tax=Eucalyptus globulus TaxID=34317 RepID=A0ABD3LAE5_EUCGL
MGEREMEVDWSSFPVLANTSELVREGLLIVSPVAQTRPSKLPQIFWDKIQEVHGRGVMLVLQKKLCASDVDPRQYRLSMPSTKIDAKFLTSEESQALKSEKGITVSLIEPCLKVRHGLQLKKWMNDSVNFSYLLTKGWNAVAQSILWSFRANGDLCFCLVNCEAPPAAVENTANHE